MQNQSESYERSVLVTGLELHRNAARFFVQLATALDGAQPAAVEVRGEPIKDFDARNNASLAAVLSSHAAVDAFLNELYLCHEENLYPVMQIERDFASRLDMAWRSGADRFSIRGKIDLALALKGVEPIDWDRGVSQDLLLLGKLRNELVHHKARWIDDSLEGSESIDSIERQLHGRFELAKWSNEGAVPFRWMKCLGAGCAKWAWNTSRVCINEVSRRLGLALIHMRF